MAAPITRTFASPLSCREQHTCVGGSLERL